MKISVFKQKGNKETIVRQEIDLLAQAITDGEFVGEVHRLREYYHLLHPRRTEDGRMVTDFKFRMDLPRICFAAEVDNYRKKQRILAYNGLIVLEANNLADYDEAVQIRNAAARLPQTMMTFLGASGRSVKIVCRVSCCQTMAEACPRSRKKSNASTYYYIRRLERPIMLSSISLWTHRSR